ncbi:MAG: hypothetical protein RR714_07525, partial [Aurantimicrobium sp.]
DKIPQDAGGFLGKIRDFFREGKFQEAANEIYKTLDVEKAQNQAIYGNGGSGGNPNGNASVGGGWSSGGWGGGSSGGGGGYTTGTVTVGGSSNNRSNSPGQNKKVKEVVFKEN